MYGDNKMEKRDFMKLNEYALKKLQEKNPNLMDISIKGNLLFYEGKTIDISNFSIGELMTDELPLINNINSLNSEDVFTIIELHALLINSKIKMMNDSKRQQATFQSNKSNQLFAQTFKKFDQLGRERQYIHVVDSFGKDNVYVNERHESFDDMDEFINNVCNTSTLSPEELCNFLEQKFRKIHLTDTYDLARDSKTNEDFNNKIRNFDEQHRNDRNFAVGNVEEDILISNDHTISSYKRDREGNLIQENFANAEIKKTMTDSVPTHNHEETEKREEIQNQQSSNNDRDSFVNNEVDEFKIINLISFEEFSNLINSEDKYTQKEEYEIGLFNGYLEKLMLYEDYLLPDLQRILNMFKHMIEVFEVAEDGTLNRNQNKELNKFYEMQEKNEKIKKDNNQLQEVNSNVNKLILQKPNINSGYIKTKILIIVMLVTAALLSLAVVCYLLVK